MAVLFKCAADLGIEPSSRSENEYLFQSIKEGKQSAKRLAEGNIPYVINMVEIFIDEFPGYEYLKDDLISEGFLTVVRIADFMTIEDIPDENYFPQTLLSTSLKNAFLNLVRVERTVQLEPSMVEGLSYSTVPSEELLMDIIAICENDVERQVVLFKCAGVATCRISDLVDVTTRQLRSISERLEKRCYKVLEISDENSR